MNYKRGGSLSYLSKREIDAWQRRRKLTCRKGFIRHTLQNRRDKIGNLLIKLYCTTAGARWLSTVHRFYSILDFWQGYWVSQATMTISSIWRYCISSKGLLPLKLITGVWRDFRGIERWVKISKGWHNLFYKSRTCSWVSLLCQEPIGCITILKYSLLWFEKK